MVINTSANLIHTLQTAIGPVILISGLGLFLLTMTNRLGSAIDRARILSSELKNNKKSDSIKIHAQLHILWKRAKIIRLAITFISLSGLLASLMIITIFFTALLTVEGQILIISLFTLCIFFLIVSFILFLYDIYKSLSALNLELDLSNQ